MHNSISKDSPSTDGGKPEEKGASDIHSEEVQEIMGSIPGWIIRWGLLVVFTIFSLIIIGSWFFSYPEVVTAPLIITTYNTPAVLEAKTGGRIDRLLVTNEQVVKEGQVVAVIKSATDYNDLLSLEKEIFQLEEPVNWDSVVCSDSFSKIYLLGELQNQYINFLKNRKQFSYYIRQNHLLLKSRLLEKQIKKQEEIYLKQLKQLKYKTEELELARKSFGRDSMLCHLGNYALTKAEYEMSRQRFIQKISSFIGFESSLKSTEVSNLRLQETKIELQLQLERELNQYRMSLDESLQLLKSYVISWKEKYVLISPIEGKITFTGYWNENQVIKAGDRLATVVPLDETRIIAKAVIPPVSIGKVEKGQDVHIKLSGFPYMEFGMLQGKVSSISLVPIKEGYVAEIELIGGMKSSYSEQLKFIQQMDGTAEIITRKMRLISRFINPLRALIDKQRDGMIN
jgi:multidrug efflux pump subunit AcrA (membrane-fusion protein)